MEGIGAAYYLDVPRKGNVDRNVYIRVEIAHCSLTFPARGTWIEI